GQPLTLCPAHSGVFQLMEKAECYFINGTDKVRYVQKYSYNREQVVMYDSVVGHFVGFTPFGEKVARYINSKPETLEYKRSEVDRLCRHNYKIFAPFGVERRVHPSPSQSIPVH
ncbi:HB2D protein, partial [Illadopsis cleaveri]|nr:HB2D protein [Illadopsis cleaveri]